MRKPLIKYCGVRSKADLKIMSSSRADFIGFIFAESKRKVKPHIVKEWLNEVDIKDKKLVAVFVNPTKEELNEVLSCLPINIIQFHGNESINDLKEAKEKFDGQIWKALHHHESTLNEMEFYHDFVDGYVVDSRMKGHWGGTGVSFDWTAIPAYIHFAQSHNKLCLIAGGVNEHNIKNLLTFNPQGIDLSSGIEVENKKSLEKIQLIEERMLQHDSIS